MPDEVAARVKDELIVPLLTSEHEWAQTAWEDYADEIVEADIKDGVTSIGDIAFFNCNNLRDHIEV